LAHTFTKKEKISTEIKEKIKKFSRKRNRSKPKNNDIVDIK
jgi:hypothetical protein